MIELLTPDEMARAIKIPKRQVYEAVSAGQLPCIRIGRRMRFSRAAIERWIADQMPQAQAADHGEGNEGMAAKAK